MSLTPHLLASLDLGATIDGKSVKDMINDTAWNKDTFLPIVGKRGAAIIEARGLSSRRRGLSAAPRSRTGTLS